MALTTRTTRSRNWLFTAWNIQDFLEFWSSLIGSDSTNSKIRAIIWQPEICPTTNREHIQGFLQTNHQISKKTAIKLIRTALPTNFLKMSHYATIDDNIKYCTDLTKQRFIINESDTYRVWPSLDAFQKAKQRSDLKALVEAIHNGTTNSQLQMDDALRHIYFKYQKHTRTYRATMLKSSVSLVMNVSVGVIWGDPGTGKSYYALTQYPDAYTPIITKNGTLWFDNYTGQDTLILDDYNGEIQLRDFKRLTDNYKMMLPIKGGTTWKAWSTVIITSNYAPNTWYNKYDGALQRRLNVIDHWTGTYPDVTKVPWVHNNAMDGSTRFMPEPIIIPNKGQCNIRAHFLQNKL